MSAPNAANPARLLTAALQVRRIAIAPVIRAGTGAVLNRGSLSAQRSSNGSVTGRMPAPARRSCAAGPRPGPRQSAQPPGSSKARSRSPARAVHGSRADHRTGTVGWADGGLHLVPVSWPIRAVALVFRLTHAEVARSRELHLNGFRGRRPCEVALPTRVGAALRAHRAKI